MPVHITSGSELMGYRLTADMSAADAGTSMWTFAEKEGYEYFIKCYLSPTFPLDNAPGSEMSKSRKRERCKAFEEHVKTLEQALKNCGSDSFLVPSVDFFRHEGTYYKVTKKIRSTQREVSSLGMEEQLLILLSAAYAVKTLHEKTGFVHSDIKPENFVLQRRNGRIIANLIDFDTGFFQGHCPQADTLVGDQRYWPPELIQFQVSGKDTSGLSNKMDIFALGVTFCEYLTGKLPVFPEGYDYIGEALLDGASIQIPALVHKQLTPLIGLVKSMLHKDPAMRPSVGAAHHFLRAFNQRAFVADDTYSKIKTSIRQRVESKLSSLEFQPLRDLTKSFLKNGSALRIRGLKFDIKRRAAPVKKQYYGRKNN